MQLQNVNTPKLPDWILKQASVGVNLDVEGKMTADNAFWYLLTMCCPQIFESYAIILHPFWINWKVKDLVKSGLNIKEEQTDIKDFERVSWQQFFQIYGKIFELKTAYEVQDELSNALKENNWLIYIWFPAEGLCEKEELIFIKNQILKIYDDQTANYYYSFLKTQKWENEIIYKGQLSKLEELWIKDDIRDNPTAIYPDSKEWCIVTDYDLPFTYIGGSKALIESVINKEQFEIFELIPKFRESG